MNKTEPNSGSQKLNYHLELPAQFASWNQFYDELIRLGLIQPATSVVRIKVFRATDRVQDGESVSVYLYYERQYIERMCLEEFRQERSSHLLTVEELERLIQIVSNQASQLNDWDLLIKLKGLFHNKEHQEKK
ncbi:hypothetical protein [Spirosoma gilvum]